MRARGRGCWIVAAFAVLVIGCRGTGEQGVIRVMPLGDSITESSVGHASYRYWLWKQLAEARKPVDFVGSRTGVHAGPPLYDDFDADHEGHWGWTTLQVRREIEGWAAESRPHVVLLMLGTNDGAGDIPKTLDNLRAIVAALRKQQDGVAVLIALLPPVVGYPNPGSVWPDIALLNRAYRAFAAELDRPDSRVIVVDQWSGFDGALDSWDGVHPTESGERKIAQRFFEALIELDPWAQPGGSPGA